LGGTVSVQIGASRAAPRRRFRWQYAIVFLVVLFFGLIRIRLRDIPLERDEGEYAYAGQLILQGIPPYQLAYNMKLPGTYAAYAAILWAFGQTPAGVHEGLLVINAATIVFSFLLASRLFGTLAGVTASASYALLSLDPQVLGFAGHATHFVVLMAGSGLLLLLYGIDSKRDWPIFGAGFLMGLAFLMKQPGILFAVFGGLYLLRVEGWDKTQSRNLPRRLGVFSAGGAIPFALTCLLLYEAGVFRKFWFWTFTYAGQYAGTVSATQGWDSLSYSFPKIASSAICIWVAAGIGGVALFWDRESRSRAEFVLGLFIFSWISVCLGLFFRPHYYVLWLPAISLLAGVAVSSTTNLLTRYGWGGLARHTPLVLFVVAFAFSLFQQRAFLFEMDPIAVCRLAYPADPFPESLRVADYIKQHTSATARIAVLGSEPQIFFYSQRHSATGYIYGYSLTEEQKYATTMQKEAVSEIEAARPEVLVFVNDWVILPRSEPYFLSWAQQYIRENYELVGVEHALSISGSETKLEGWLQYADPSPPPGMIFVFKRKV
jgi:hypothetical protein